MEHVRSLRDSFVGSVLEKVEEIGDNNLVGHASFESPRVLKVGDHRIEADNIVIATGSSPIVPKSWSEECGDLISTTDDFFEWTRLPTSVAVIGLGVIGCELGQALGRLGVDVHGFSQSTWIAGLSDPKINSVAVERLKENLNIYLGSTVELKRDGSKVRVSVPGSSVLVEKVLIAIGRQPNLGGLDLDKAGIQLNGEGKIAVDPQTLNIPGSSIFVTGDALAFRPVLHEAADEGRIAGYNASTRQVQRFQRRTFLQVTFTDPCVAIVGQPFAELEGTDMVIGEVSFKKQGRSRIMGENYGHLRLYGESQTGKLLGAEFMAPGAEHMAHLLAWSIQAGWTADQLLTMPFYHPVVEEGLRTAIRHLANQVGRQHGPLEIPLIGKGATL
jgi:dihydrolipoamide dehydrogenase